MAGSTLGQAGMVSGRNGRLAIVHDFGLTAFFHFNVLPCPRGRMEERLVGGLKAGSNHPVAQAQPITDEKWDFSEMSNRGPTVATTREAM